MARRYYLIFDGQKLFGDSLAHVKEAAQHAADDFGQAVQIGYDDTAPKKRRTFAKNPDAGSYLPVWAEQEKGRQMRLDYLAATKARRLAMSLRKRGGMAYAAEAAHAKSAKFAMTARNSKEQFVLYRASRAAADALGRQFEAAGYKVTLKAV